MSGFGEIAAATGVADVAIRSIISLYDYVQDLKDVPKEVDRIKNESLTVTQCLQSLQRLLSTNPKASSEMEKIGVDIVVNQCGEACGKLENDLHKWTKSGKEALWSRVQVRRHKAKIERVTAQISVCKSTLTLAIGITTVSLQVKANTMSDEEKLALLRPLHDEVGRLEAEAQRERQHATELQQQLQQLELDDNEDSDDVEFTQSEVMRQVETYDQLLASCAIASTQIQALQANQQIGHITTDDYSKATVGMPASVVGKVRQQVIGSVSTTKHSEAKVGIF